MTKAERKALGDWLNEHEGFVVTYIVGGMCALIIFGVIADALASLLFLVISYGLIFAWPVLLLAVNGAVLLVRRRSNENLRFERRMRQLDEREQRIDALERSTGTGNYR